MDGVYILFGVIFSIIFFVVFSFLIGMGFREWNEGSSKVEDSKGSHIITFVVGAFIMIILLVMYSQCSD